MPTAVRLRLLAVTELIPRSSDLVVPLAVACDCTEPAETKPPDRPSAVATARSFAFVFRVTSRAALTIAPLSAQVWTFAFEVAVPDTPTPATAPPVAAVALDFACCPSWD